MPRIWDALNRDITPRPLSKAAHPLSTGATPLEEHMTKEFTMPTGVPTPRAATPMSDMGSDAGWAETSAAPKRSRSQSGRSTPSTSSDVGEMAPAPLPAHDVVSTIAEEEPTSGRPVTAEETAKKASPRVGGRLTAADLDSAVTISLVETPTFWMLDLVGSCVAKDSEEASAVEKENENYAALKEVKAGSDSYVDSAAQTLPNFPKNIEVQAQPPSTSEAGTMATNWDIYDAFNPNESEGEPGDRIPLLPPPAAAAAPLLQAEAAAPDGTEPEPEAGAEPEPEPEPELEPEKLADLSHIKSLPEKLSKMERMLTQNLYHEQHLEYRDYRSAQVARVAPEVTAGLETAADPALRKLWTFGCQLTDGRNVSSMAWNKDDQDLVAAAYGEFDFSVEQKDGAIALWSLKNPTHPERVYNLSCGVTAIDWSGYHPFLLAVGRYDGNVAIYDMRSEDDEPILASGNNTDKHHDPVWQVQWIDKGMERAGECLVSISTDGRVKEWRIKKGLEHQELMMMKETARPDKDGGGEQNLISHFASGLCFDFSPLDPTMYLAGTESGTIHKCSCNYNDNYLQDFVGHEPGMPVYRLRWSPFAPNIFLSCSADWTVKLWNHDNSGSTAPSKFLLSFSSSNDYVSDIRWAPRHSTVFGSVTGDGKLDIWDIEREILNPVISCDSTATGRKRLSTLLFAEQSPVVITGSSDGHIDVYRMVNLDGGLLTAKEQATNLEHVSCVPNCVCHCLFFRSRPAYHTDRAFMIRNSALQITSLARVIRLFKRTLNKRVEPVELQCTGST